MYSRCWLLTSNWLCTGWPCWCNCRCFLYSAAFLGSGGCEWVLLGWANRWCGLELFEWKLVGKEAVLERYRGPVVTLSIRCGGLLHEGESVLLKACSTSRHVVFVATELRSTLEDEEEQTEGDRDEGWTSSSVEPKTGCDSSDVNALHWWKWQGLVVLTVSNPESSDSDFTLDSGTEYLEMESNLSTPGPVCKYKSWQPSSTQLSRRFPKFLYRFIDNEFLFRYSVSFSSQSEHMKLFTAPLFSHNWLETCRSICHVELKTPFWGRPHSDNHASQIPSDNCSISGAVPKILSSCSSRICQDMLWGWWNFHKALKQSNRNYWYASWDESKYGLLCIEKMQGCNHPHTTYNKSLQ